MAVVVMWDSGMECTWEEAVTWVQNAYREPFWLHDKDAKVVACIPDFGVRYLANKSPDLITEPDPNPVNESAPMALSG